jgi:hypothetical protein
MGSVAFGAVPIKEADALEMDLLTQQVKVLEIKHKV